MPRYKIAKETGIPAKLEELLDEAEKAIQKDTELNNIARKVANKKDIAMMHAMLDIKISELAKSVETLIKFIAIIGGALCGIAIGTFIWIINNVR